jgi:hypothetical protein
MSPTGTHDVSDAQIVGYPVPAQPVDATQALNLSAGVYRRAAGLVDKIYAAPSPPIFLLSSRPNFILSSISRPPRSSAL